MEWEESNSGLQDQQVEFKTRSFMETLSLLEQRKRDIQILQVHISLLFDSSALRFQSGGAIVNTHIHNNLFIAYNGSKLVEVESAFQSIFGSFAQLR